MLSDPYVVQMPQVALADQDWQTALSRVLWLHQQLEMSLETTVAHQQKHTGMKGNAVRQFLRGSSRGIPG